MTIRELFLQSGLPAFEATQLLGEVLQMDRYKLLMEEDEQASDEETATFLKLTAKRKDGYPLQYLLGSWEFYGLPLDVGEGVLIPRSDTETLVEACLEALAGEVAPIVCDLCSGSGCVAIALGKNLPAEARLTAVELSDAAFPYLEKNLERLHCENVRAVKADVSNWETEESFDLIASNPPYLTSEEMLFLQTEVSHEPAMALAAGEDGLCFYRLISARYKDNIRPGGFLVFEVGYRQAEAVSKILTEAGYSNVRLKKDLTGVERVVIGSR